MDRAHRIGQTKTVHVFRLIVKDSIEEVCGCAASAVFVLFFAWFEFSRYVRVG
jgi:hypothetical protein